MSSHATPYDDDDDYRPRHRSPSRRRSRDYSPDYHSGGSRMTGAIPAPVIAPPYDGPTPFYPPPAPRNNPNNSLQVPYSPARPRSQPPLSRDRDRSRDGSRDRRDRSRDRRADRDRRDRDKDKDRDAADSEDDDRDRPTSPLGKAKSVMQNTFSDSTSGLGVGVMGAIIGGLAAREATEAASRKANAKGGGGRSRRGSDANQGAALLSTLVGAAVGGLGANALEKRIEKSRNKTKDEQGRWERKFGRDAAKDDGGRREKDGPPPRDRSRDRERERRERERAVDMEEGRAGGRVERRRGDYYDDDSEPDYVYDQRHRRRRSED
ncbi:hypothetical protein CONLIGDRAFT_449009 [Coniochaeta ligniaria NRRL 30616]|uniref:Glycine zipper 2TM domain-containing protein n=1 Tax=Coniochaeta ligniaria NRRL 30616 TaxID=1408157 RepID=A0A1J7JJC0_9PEZI|nr:hypothetical protein CONLIGDRAFT_449009 [Coniochaeta ligniaria NRRL 30616]